jgi:hypothetical protein
MKRRQRIDANIALVGYAVIPPIEGLLQLGHDRSRGHYALANREILGHDARHQGIAVKRIVDDKRRTRAVVLHPGVSSGALGMTATGPSAMFPR